MGDKGGTILLCLKTNKPSFLHARGLTRPRPQGPGEFYGRMEGKGLQGKQNGRLGWNNFELLEGWAGAALGNWKVGWEHAWEIGR